MREHQHLPFHGLFGESLRHVAVRGEVWLALLGWQAGVQGRGSGSVGRLHAGAAVRAAASGREQRPLLGSAGRAGSVPRIAGAGGWSCGGCRGTCAPRTAIRCAGGDVRGPVAVRGHVLPGVGLGTGGAHARLLAGAGGMARWRAHGQPKEVDVYELETGAAALRGGDLPDDWRAGGSGAVPAAPELRSPHAFLEDMPDFRKARGVRYGLACHATIMIAARLAGYRGVAAFGDFAARMDQQQLPAAARPSVRAGAIARRRRRSRSTTSCRRCRRDALDRAAGRVDTPAQRRGDGGGAGLAANCGSTPEDGRRVGARQRETARAGRGLRRRLRGHRRESQPGDDARRPAGDRLGRAARHADGGWEKGPGRLKRRRCPVFDLGGPECRGGRPESCCGWTATWPMNVCGASPVVSL